MNLNSVMIGSQDPKVLSAFNTKLFGQPSRDDGGFTGWTIGDGSLMVGPHDKVHGKNAEAGRLMWNVECPDVQADFERLRDRGATVVQEPYSPGDESEMSIATLADRDGNYFQPFSPM
jgi:predicted enzyme related to lactoylglutathione lyase